MKRATRLSLAALASLARVLPAPRATAQGGAPVAAPQKPAAKPAKPARTEADTTTDEAQASDDALPPAPTVVDPMLDPLPPPRRTVGSWEDALSLVRARSTDLRLAFDEVEKAEGQSRIALAGALTQVNATGSLTHNFLQGNYPIAPGVNLAYPTRNVLAGQIGLVQPVLSPRAWYAVGTAHRAEDAARLTL